MDIIDDVLGTNNGKNYTNNISKEDWKDKQKQDRNEIYQTMDKMAIEVRDNPEKFKKYLEIQSRFSKYSVGNCLVLLDKAPDSSHLRDKKSWEDKGYSLKDNAQEIKILEPKIVGDNTYYNPKIVYDVSQTNCEERDKVKNYNDRTLLEALLYNVDAKQVPVDELSNGQIGAEYDKENNVLYVCRGMNRDLLFKAITQELANYELRNDNSIENEDLKSFYNYCTSYMICQRYGMDVSGFDFRNLPSEIKEQSEGKEVRYKLEKIRMNYEKLNSRMMQYFEDTSKEKSKKAQER